MDTLATTTASDTEVVGRRVVQFLVDSFLLGLGNVALLALFLAAPTGDDGSVDSGSVAFWVIAAAVAVGTVLWTLYVWIIRPHRHDGQTFGMRAMGIQVVGADGTPASSGQLLGRAILLVVDVGATPLIGLIVMIVTSRNQRVGDLVASTIVRRA